MVFDRLELVRFLQILRLWTRREVTARYAGSLIGVLWAFLLPLGNIALFYFVFAVVLKVRIPELNLEHGYFFYLLAGLLPWMGLAEGITRATYSLVVQEQLIQKIAFPVAVFPVSAVLASLLPQLIGMLIFLGLLAISGLLTFSTLGLIPLLLCQLAMTCGLGLLLAVLAAGFRDLLHLVPILVQFLFYATPILYSRSMVPEEYQVWFFFNPFAALVDGYHAVLLSLPLPISSLLALLVWTGLLGGGGLWLFRTLRGALGDWL
ncbi:hypothetical protein JCM13664_12970 [Methylothermus subterraneus]